MKKLQGSIERKASVQGKFFLSSIFTPKSNPASYRWYIAHDNTSGNYEIKYAKGNIPGGSQVSIRGGKISSLLTQEKIDRMQKQQQDAFQKLRITMDASTAAKEMEKYEWRSLANGTFIYEKNSTQGKTLFADRHGVFSKSLNLAVLSEMLKLETPPPLAEGAKYGSCLGFSILWLELFAGGQTGLDKREQALTKDNKKAQPATGTESQRRMELLRHRSGAEGAKWQKMYSDGITANVDHEQGLYSLHNNALRKQNKFNFGRHADPVKNAAFQQAKKEAEQIKKQIDALKPNAAKNDIIADVFNLSGLAVEAQTVHSEPAQTFMDKLIDKVPPGGMAQYNFAFVSTLDGKHGRHATTLSRDGDTFTWFDPNYGEFKVPAHELKTFLALFLKEKYGNLPFEQTLRNIAVDTEHEGLHEIFDPNAHKQKSAGSHGTESELQWVKEGNQWVQKGINPEAKSPAAPVATPDKKEKPVEEPAPLPRPLKHLLEKQVAGLAPAAQSAKPAEINWSSMEKQILDIDEPEQMLVFVKENFGNEAADAVKKELATSADKDRISWKQRQGITSLLKKFLSSAVPKPAAASPKFVAPAAAPKPIVATPAKSDPAFSSIEKQFLNMVDPGKLSGFIEKHFGKQAAADVEKRFKPQISNAIREDYLQSKDILDIRDFLKNYPLARSGSPAPLAGAAAKPVATPTPVTPAKVDPAFLAIENQLLKIPPAQIQGLVEKHFGKQAAVDVEKRFKSQLNNANLKGYLSAKDRLDISNFLKGYPILPKPVVVNTPKPPAVELYERPLKGLIKPAVVKPAAAAGLFATPAKLAAVKLGATLAKKPGAAQQPKLADALPPLLERTLTKEEHQAGEKIRDAFRAHLKKVKAAKPNSMGNVKLVYDGDKAKEKGKEYYLHLNKDPNKKGVTDDRVVYRPVLSPGIAAKGAFKQVDKVDNPTKRRFISLVPVKAGTDFRKDAQVNNDDLRGMDAVVYNKVVADKLMIARDAGTPAVDVKTGVSRLIQVKLSAFKRAAENLDSLHQKGTFLIDIKPENMAYDEKKKQISFIDVDGRVNKASGYSGISYTPTAATKGLLNALYGSNTQRLNALRAWDNYAFFLGAMQLTGSDQLVRAARHPYGVLDTIGGKYPSVMSPANQHLFEAWINQHVNPDDRNHALQLLQNPAEFAKKPANHKPLAEMLLFTS